LLQVIPIYASFRAFGYNQLSIGVAFVLMVILRIGSIVPQAPGNIGLFQLLTMETLQRIFHVHDRVAGFQLVLWGTVTIPLIIAGSIAMMFTGLNLFKLKREAEDHANLNRP
jgi:hypothetical protein